jgi:hypothetical protein
VTDIAAIGSSVGRLAFGNLRAGFEHVDGGTSGGCLDGFLSVFDLLSHDVAEVFSTNWHERY